MGNSFILIFLDSSPLESLAIFFDSTIFCRAFLHVLEQSVESVSPLDHARMMIQIQSFHLLLISFVGGCSQKLVRHVWNVAIFPASSSKLLYLHAPANLTHHAKKKFKGFLFKAKKCWFVALLINLPPHLSCSVAIGLNSFIRIFDALHVYSAKLASALWFWSWSSLRFRIEKLYFGNFVAPSSQVRLLYLFIDHRHRIATTTIFLQH